MQMIRTEYDAPHPRGAFVFRQESHTAVRGKKALRLPQPWRNCGCVQLRDEEGRERRGVPVIKSSVCPDQDPINQAA